MMIYYKKNYSEEIPLVQPSEDKLLGAKQK